MTDPDKVLLVLQTAVHHFNQSTLFHTATNKYTSKEIHTNSKKGLRQDLKEHLLMTQRSQPNTDKSVSK